MNDLKTVSGNSGQPKKTGNRNRKLNAVMRRKLAGLFICVVLALICLLIRITYINATSGDRYRKQVLANYQNRYSSQTLAYKRGDILDRNGTVLATSEKRYDVILDCSVVNSSEEYAEPTIRALKDVLGADETQVRILLEGETTRKSQYQVLMKNVSIAEKQAFDRYRTGTANTPLSAEEKKERANVKGVWFEEHYVRTYPMNELAGEVLGFVYDTDKADWGIEGYYNHSLCGVDGRKYGYWDSDAEIEQTIVDPVDGNTVKSTIDANIQGLCEQTIASFEEQFREGPFSSTQAAKNIGVVVMNPNDGSVLAMASNRNYNPNKPRDLTRYYSEEQIAAMSDDQIISNLQSVWRNFCISDAFEPGSVFKPMTIASALECGAVNESSGFVCDGYETVAGVRIKCSNTEGHGEETLLDLIRNSCNDGLMQVGSSLGVDAFCKYQKMFNFGSRTGIDLSGEAAGIVGAADTMGSVDLATASFGQGFTCTMVQEIAAVCSIINGGNYYRPHVVSRIVGPDGNIKKSFDSVLMKQTVSSDVAADIRSYMKASVDDGTSKYAKVDGYSMGGKTGTAQKIPRGNGKYLVSFIGFAPVDNPQVAIYVIVDELNVAEQADNRYPQWIARDILQQVLPYLNIYPDEPSDPSNEYLQMDYTNLGGDSAEGTEQEETEDGEEEDTDTYYYDEEGDRRNSDGHLVDQEGYLINSDSQYVDENDQVIDESMKIRAGEKVHAAQDTNVVNGTGENTDIAADTNVPEPSGLEDTSLTQGGNNMETDGYTNEEAGLD